MELFSLSITSVLIFSFETDKKGVRSDGSFVKRHLTSKNCTQTTARFMKASEQPSEATCNAY